MGEQLLSLLSCCKVKRFPGMDERLLGQQMLDAEDVASSAHPWDILSVSLFVRMQVRQPLAVVRQSLTGFLWHLPHVLLQVYTVFLWELLTMLLCAPLHSKMRTNLFYFILCLLSVFQCVSIYRVFFSVVLCYLWTQIVYPASLDVTFRLNVTSFWQSSGLICLLYHKFQSRMFSCIGGSDMAYFVLWGITKLMVHKKAFRKYCRRMQG